MRKEFVSRLVALAIGLASCVLGAEYLVEGVVLDSQSHAPLANMRVSLASTGARARKTEQTTGQNGQFSFRVGEPGKYSLKANKIGYPPQIYKQMPLTSYSSAIVVRDDQDTRHIVFEAKRGGSIAGQIRDEEAEPVGYALVSLFQSVTFNGERKILHRSEGRANAVGEFRFRSLQPGNYFVCAAGRPWFADQLIQLQRMSELPVFSRHRGPRPDVVEPADADADDDPPEKPDQPAEPPPPFSPDPAFHGTAFMTAFYPGVKSIEAASLIRVDPGSEARASIVLPLTTAVSVKGTIGKAGAAGSGKVDLRKKIHDKYLSFQDTWVGPEGSFQFTNVPAGSYEIVATSQSSTGPSSWHISQEVEVGSADMEIQLRPSQLGSWSGHVLFEGDPPASSAGLFVALQNETGVVARIEVSPDGSFSVKRLPAGTYEITAGSRRYIAAYLKGTASERLPLNIEIPPGAPVSQDIVLTNAVSVINGEVAHAGVPQIGAFVILIPKNPAARWAYRFDQTDSDGSYTLPGIPEGDYFAIALSTGEDVAFRDAKVGAILTKTGKPVHVDASKEFDLDLDVVDTKSLNLPQL